MRKAHNFQDGVKKMNLTGTAVPPVARAVPTFWPFSTFGLDEGTAVPPQARAVPTQARAVPTFWRLRCKNFPFLELVVNDYLENNEKQTKRKAIKCVGCLPRSALLMSLA